MSIIDIYIAMKTSVSQAIISRARNMNSAGHAERREEINANTQFQSEYS